LGVYGKGKEGGLGRRTETMGENLWVNGEVSLALSNSSWVHHGVSIGVGFPDKTMVSLIKKFVRGPGTSGRVTNPVPTLVY
jgi:hypothetical protein